MEILLVYLQARLFYHVNVVKLKKWFKISNNNKLTFNVNKLQNSAIYFEKQFPDRRLVVIAALEFALMNLAVLTWAPKTQMKGEKLIRAFFEYFLAMSSMVLYVNYQEDDNIEQDKVDRYQAQLDQINTMTEEEVQQLTLNDYQDTYMADWNDLQQSVQGIVHDESINDGTFRFELEQVAAYHLFKHNVRDVYDDKLKYDKRFILAADYLIQANDIVNPLYEQDGSGRYLRKYNSNRDYFEHYRQTFIEKRIIGRDVKEYLGSHFKLKINDTNLQSMIENKRLAFGRATGEPIGLSEYCVSWQLIKQLAKSLDQWHSKDKAYKTFRPDNVHIHYTGQLMNIKLPDLDLIQGVLPDINLYKAPELVNPGQHHLKSDIYSLAMMTLLIFGFDVDLLMRDQNQSITPDEWENWFASDPAIIYHGTQLHNTMNDILKYLGDCLTQNHDNFDARPDCKQFLDEVKNWSMDHLVQTDADSISFDDYIENLANFNSIPVLF